MNDSSLLVLILDESGSMGPVKAGTLEGINSFIREQKAIPGDAEFLLIHFNETCRVIAKYVPLQNMGEVNDYFPNNMTALYDAVCKTIDGIGEHLRKMDEANRPSKIIVGIMTDGQENASRLFNFLDMKSRIEHQTNIYKWTFVFLGASLEDCETMIESGVSKNLTFQYDANTNQGVTRGYHLMSHQFSAARK